MRMFLMWCLSSGLLVFVSSVLTEGDVCPVGRHGENCELECEEPYMNDSACRDDRTSEQVCSGRGRCVCGQWCECNQVSPSLPHTYSGRFCQCNDWSCAYNGGQICGGPNQGRCRCGHCQCEMGYKGRACECPTSSEACRAKNGLLCNGKGPCVCGRCTCNLDTYYRGPTCEDCPTCPGRCEQLKACVQCKAFMTGPMSEEDCDAKCTHVALVDVLENSPDVKQCRFLDDDDNMFYFSYDLDSGHVEAKRTKGNEGVSNSPFFFLVVALQIIYWSSVLI